MIHPLTTDRRDMSGILELCLSNSWKSIIEICSLPGVGKTTLVKKLIETEKYKRPLIIDTEGSWYYYSQQHSSTTVEFAFDLKTFISCLYQHLPSSNPTENENESVVSSFDIIIIDNFSLFVKWITTSSTAGGGNSKIPLFYEIHQLLRQLMSHFNCNTILTTHMTTKKDEKSEKIMPVPFALNLMNSISFHRILLYWRQNRTVNDRKCERKAELVLSRQFSCMSCNVK